MTESTELVAARRPEQTAYDQQLLEQYKVYVEMTDRVATRRQTASTFFLTMNTALVSFMALTWTKDGSVSLRLALLAMAMAGTIVCVVWRRLVSSYRQLNAGRFQVLHLIEQQLPLRLHAFEWQVLGEGHDPKKYHPLTHVESVVPLVFAALYVLIALVLLGALLGCR